MASSAGTMGFSRCVGSSKSAASPTEIMGEGRGMAVATGGFFLATAASKSSREVAFFTGSSTNSISAASNSPVGGSFLGEESTGTMGSSLFLGSLLVVIFGPG